MHVKYLMSSVCIDSVESSKDEEETSVSKPLTGEGIYNIRKLL